MRIKCFFGFFFSYLSNFFSTALFSKEEGGRKAADFMGAQTRDDKDRGGGGDRENHLQHAAASLLPIIVFRSRCIGTSGRRGISSWLGLLSSLRHHPPYNFSANIALLYTPPLGLDPLDATLKARHALIDNLIFEKDALTV